MKIPRRKAVGFSEKGNKNEIRLDGPGLDVYRLDSVVCLPSGDQVGRCPCFHMVCRFVASVGLWWPFYGCRNPIVYDYSL